MTIEDTEKYTATVRVDRRNNSDGTGGVIMEVEKLEELLEPGNLANTVHKIVEDTKNGWSRLVITIDKVQSQS